MTTIHYLNARAVGPRPEFIARSRFVTINGYAFHIGLALVFFGYAPHIAFVERLIGIGWPALPDPVMYLSASLTIVTLLIALSMRLSDPVRRSISTADDTISWTLTFLPFVTGMAVAGEPSSSILARDHVISLKSGT